MCSENGFEGDRSDAVRALFLVFTTLGRKVSHSTWEYSRPYVEIFPPNMELTVQYISATDHHRLELFLLALHSHFLKISLK